MATILIVDDEKLILDFLKERLIRKGFEVLTAMNGKEGLHLYNNNKVDLVITDIIMADKSGFGIITELKDISQDIKIIAMSGGGHAHPKFYLDIAKSLGVQYTLQKPFKTSELLEVVSELLKKE